MNYPSIGHAFAVFSLLLASGLQAAEVDLSGGWKDEDGHDITLVQDGSKVLELQRDPDLIAFFGEHSFIAKMNGNSLRGEIAVTLPLEQKQFCGKNWGQWRALELELSSDGNRLEGRLKHFTKDASEVGCPVTKVEWRPYVLMRAAKPTPPAPVQPKQPTPAAPELPQPVLPMTPEPPEPPIAPSPNYLLGGLSLLGLSLVFFFIRSAFENYLVGSKKRSPHTAGMAGWALFGGLLLGSAIGSAALVGSSYWVLPVVIPLAVLSLLCLAMCAVFSGKK